MTIKLQTRHSFAKSLISSFCFIRAYFVFRLHITYNGAGDIVQCQAHDHSRADAFQSGREIRPFTNAVQMGLYDLDKPGLQHGAGQHPPKRTGIEQSGG